MRKSPLFLLLLLLVTTVVGAQKPHKLNSHQIYERIQKLNFLGTALYIAAHPDDENTRLIAYLSNHVKARTAYLSLTRGDGGQNLIGPEIRELLGVIRTQELLAARRIDGGEQRFSRANDFGYSKHPEETLEIWDRESVLADVVWAIRTFKPDVVINRFNHRTPGTTHGHHTASAMLSVEAFDLANKQNICSDQLALTEVWQPKRLFFNTSWWFYGSQERFEKATKDNPKFMSVDVGVYYPLKGLSNNEIASMASSQHLCQGFGRLTTRGSQPEYLEFLKGDAPKDKHDLFAGINTTWNRLKDGGEIGDILYNIEDHFDFTNPAKHVPDLLKAYKKIQMLDDAYWRSVKLKEITEIIEASLGLYLEVSASSSSAVPNSEIELNVEVLNRSTVTTFLEEYRIVGNPVTDIELVEIPLENNKKVQLKKNYQIANVPYSDPYWLRDQWSLGMYKVDDQKLIGNPETPRRLQVEFVLNINEYDITITKDVIRRYSQRDKGELYDPFEVLPRATTRIKEKVLLFPDNTSKTVAVAVRAGANRITGNLTL
ncbi:MAG: PIG-L family deacetylase, partial [Flavobacteriales bacterium]|nr:PIG-L family deacetylase [Flavobacteriales bacterium]